MKTWFSRLIFALLPLVSLNAVAGGHELGNGGDANEIEFGMYAFAAYEALVKNPTILPEISRELYREKLFASRFEATEEVLYDRFGKRKMALNFPGKVEIVFNRSDWEGLVTRPELKVALATHEVLGLAGVEVNEYDLTETMRGFANEIAATAANVLPVRLAGFSVPAFLIRTSVEFCGSQGAKRVKASKLARAFHIQTNEIDIIFPKGGTVASDGRCKSSGNIFSAPKISSFRLMGPDQKTWIPQIPRVQIYVTFYDNNSSISDVSGVFTESEEGGSLTYPQQVCGGQISHASELYFSQNRKLVGAKFRAVQYPMLNCRYFRGQVFEYRVDEVTNELVEVYGAHGFLYDPSVPPSEVRIDERSPWMKSNSIPERQEFYSNGKPKVLRLSEKQIRFKLNGVLYPLTQFEFNANGEIRPLGVVFERSPIWMVEIPSMNGLKTVYPLSGSQPDHVTGRKIADQICVDAGFDRAFESHNSAEYDLFGEEDFYDRVLNRVMTLKDRQVVILSESIACFGVSRTLPTSDLVYTK